MNVLLSLGGMNATNPRPTNPFQQALYSVAKSINNALDPAPPPGTPTVGIPDTNTGAVAGTLGFPTGSGLTYTVALPTHGSLALSGDGTYTYTPTQAARQAATASSTDTFTVTVHNGLSTSSVTITVPIDPGTPVAGTPTVGTPNAATGTVTGTAKFTDTAGRTLTYSTTATSTGGGTVTLNTTTGAFTYTPTDAQRQTADINATDTFTITSSNGVRTATQTITVAVDVSSPIAGAPTVGAPNTTTGEVTGNAKFTDAAGRTLTYSTTTTSTGGGTVTLNTTTGAFTYTPTQTQRQAAGLNTTDTITITASNGVHTTNQTITVTVDPGIPILLGPPIVGKPNAILGVVNGYVSAVDTAGRNLIYSVSALSSGGGAVTIHAGNGFIYTPTFDQREAANSATTDTFIITVSNGLRSITQTVTVPVLSLPALSAGQIALPGTPNSRPVAGPNGEVYQTSVNTKAGKFGSTYVTIVRQDGTTTTYSQPGTSYDGAVVSPNGNVYQSSSTGNAGDDYATYTTTLRVIHPDGTTTDYTTAGTTGIEKSVAIGADGTVYQTLRGGNSTSGYTTSILVIRPDGSSATRLQTGAPSGRLIFAPDGTAYQFSGVQADSTHTGATSITAFKPDGTMTTYAFAGTSISLMSGPNSTRYLNVSTYNATTQSYEGSLNTLNSDGTLTVIPGVSSSIVDANGNFYRNTTSSSGESTVTVVHTDGTITTTALTGQAFNRVVVDRSGHAYQASVSANSTTVTVFNPDGTTATYTQSGEPWFSAVVGTDGNVYQTTYNASTNTSTIRAFRSDGTTTVRAQLGQPVTGGIVVGADGTTYYVTSEMVAAYRIDGTVVSFTPSGDQVVGITLGDDGTIYQTGYVYSGLSSSTVVTVRRPNGTIDNYSIADDGVGIVVIAEDGTPYQATSTGLWNLNKTPKTSV